MQRREFIKSLLGSALLWKAPALLAYRVLHPAGARSRSEARAGDVQVSFRRRLCRHTDGSSSPLFHGIFSAGHGSRQPTAPIRQRALRVDHGIMAALRIPGAGNARRSASGWREAISAGDIAWHALPFTWQTELMDASMISGGIGLSRDAGPAFWPDYDRRQDDRRARPHSRPDRPAGRAGCEVSGYRRERREHAGGSSSLVSLERSGRIVARSHVSPRLRRRGACAGLRSGHRHGRARRQQRAAHPGRNSPDLLHSG